MNACNDESAKHRIHLFLQYRYVAKYKLLNDVSRSHSWLAQTSKFLFKR
ncbi:MAG: hypothetical protein RLZZ628_1071 [Bacteroidota bacterium]|jgi:hypothetical protein